MIFITSYGIEYIYIYKFIKVSSFSDTWDVYIYLYFPIKNLI